MKKLNKSVMKIFSLLSAIMFVFSQNIFAESIHRRFETITEDYKTPGFLHKNYIEDNGPGGVFFVTGSNKLTLDVTCDTIFWNNMTRSDENAYGGVIEVDNSSATVKVGHNVNFDNNSACYGGAIHISEAEKIEMEDNVFFSSNTASDSGGAIYNKECTITIGESVLFESNSTTDYSGGAIYNENGTITIGSNALFRENEADDDGGAIYNENGTITVGSNALFQENKAKDDGGIIYNETGTITIGSNAKFENNESYYYGAICNYDGHITIGSNALFQNNKADNGETGHDATGYGGAIYNKKTVTIADGAVFKNNVSKCDGGAIYNRGLLELFANNKNIEFTGNKQYIGTGDEQSNAIYNTSEGLIYLWASYKANIIFNDSIIGTGAMDINRLTQEYQDNIKTGKIVLNADMSGYTGKVNFYGGTIELGKDGTMFGNGITEIIVDNATISMSNGKTENAGFGMDFGGHIEINNELDLSVDADLKNKKIDMVVFGTPIVGNGKVNVKKINVIEDNGGSATRLDFAKVSEDKLVSVNSAKSVFYNYDVKLEYGKIEYDINGYHNENEDGYFYTFTKKSINSVTAAGALSAYAGGYATQSVIANQAFASMDRQTVKSATKATNGKQKTDKKDTKQAPKKSSNKKKVQSMGLLYASAGDQIFAEQSKIERGAWLRPFVLNETVKAGNIDVDNSLYGTLAGIDLPVKGDMLASFYLGYAGSKQKVEDVKSNQTGYVLGATGMLIKEKWYAGLTANIIFNKASVDSDDRTNDINLNMFSIGAKAGYNYVINEKWTLEPNIILLYGIVNCGSYNTDRTKVDSLNVNNILFEPQVKARLQTENGWQPYGLLGYAANLTPEPTVKTEAGNLKLDSIDGYVEFGAGVNKDFLNTAWSCYAQLTGRAAGRSGVAGNLGVKYKF